MINEREVIGTPIKKVLVDFKSHSMWDTCSVIETGRTETQHSISEKDSKGRVVGYKSVMSEGRLVYHFSTVLELKEVGTLPADYRPLHLNIDSKAIEEYSYLDHVYVVDFWKTKNGDHFGAMQVNQRIFKTEADAKEYLDKKISKAMATAEKLVNKENSVNR